MQTIYAHSWLCSTASAATSSALATLAEGLLPDMTGPLATATAEHRTSQTRISREVMITACYTVNERTASRAASSWCEVTRYTEKSLRKSSTASSTVSATAPPAFVTSCLSSALLTPQQTAQAKPVLSLFPCCVPANVR